MSVLRSIPDASLIDVFHAYLEFAGPLHESAPLRARTRANRRLRFQAELLQILSRAVH